MIETGKNLLYLLRFVTFRAMKNQFLKTAAQTFEAGDFLNMFLSYLGF